MDNSLDGMRARHASVIQEGDESGVEKRFPMWVLPVQELFNMRRFVVHEELMSRGV